MPFEKVFHSKLGHKLIKSQNFLYFSDKSCSFSQNFAKETYIFFVPKVLRIFYFLPLKTPLPSLKLKTGQIPNFFQTPLRYI